MSVAVVAVLAVLAAWNPPATAMSLGPPSRARAVGLALAAAVGIVLGASGETLLDLLDLSAPTFRTAAGVVVAVSGAAHVWGRTAIPVEGDGVFGGAVAGLYPAPVFAAVTAGVDAWWLPAAGAVVASAALSWWLATRTGDDRAVTSWAVRLVGAIAVLVGVAMVVSGVKSV
jgi:small neutral amino acid transporter SnatA (MarC family)